MNEFGNEFGAMPEGFSAVSLDELDQVEGGSTSAGMSALLKLVTHRAVLFEVVKSLQEKYDQPANDVIRSISR